MTSKHNDSTDSGSRLRRRQTGRSSRAGTWNAKFHPGLHEGVDVRTDVRTDVLRTDDFLRTKISWIHSLPNFLTHGAPLRYEALFFYHTDLWQNLFFLRVNIIENLLCLGLIPFIYKTVYGFDMRNL